MRGDRAFDEPAILASTRITPQEFMRVLLQRVSRAEVRVRESGAIRTTGRIGRGFLLLVGFTNGDDEARVEWMADKIVGLRLLADTDDKLNLAIADVRGELPRPHALRLARGKANAIATPDAVTIGSDTIVVIDGDVLGKPADEAEAAQMLRRLSGRSHTVITAVAVSWRGRMVDDAEEVA